MLLGYVVYKWQFSINKFIFFITYFVLYVSNEFLKKSGIYNIKLFFISVINKLYFFIFYKTNFNVFLF